MLGVSRDKGSGLIYGDRVLAGTGVGAFSTTVPICTSEHFPSTVRGHRLVLRA